MLTELIARLRSGELTVDEFATTAAENFVRRDPASVAYPETDGNEAVLDGVSAATITSAQISGDLTGDEAQAIYDALLSIGS